jgi:hypothetical protein
MRRLKNQPPQIEVCDVVFKYPGPGGWHFVKVGAVESKMIRSMDHLPRIALGYVPVTVTLGKTTWKTTLFPSKDGPYLLAIKSDIRKKEKVVAGDRVTMRVLLRG